MDTRRTTSVKAQDLRPGDRLWLYGWYINVRNVSVDKYVALNDTFGLDREKMLRVSVPRNGPVFKRKQNGDTPHHAH